MLIKKLVIVILHIPRLGFPIICADKDPTLKRQYLGVVFQFPLDLMVHKSCKKNKRKRKQFIGLFVFIDFSEVYATYQFESLEYYWSVIGLLYILGCLLHLFRLIISSKI